MSSSEFGVPSLEAMLKNCYEICCVVTQPDRAKGRGLAFGPGAIKKSALEKGLTLHQPVKVNSPESLEFLAGLEPDLLVVVAYGQILSQKILDIPRIMPINIHGSLLPAYRGPAPVNWALINGEALTGTTLMKVRHKLDSGPVIERKERRVEPGDDAVTLEAKLALDGAQLLIDGLQLIARGACRLEEQDETGVSYAPKLKKADGKIDWDQPAKAVFNRVLGLAGWPGTFTFFKGKMVKVIKAELSENKARSDSGTVTGISKEGISVACASGELLLKTLQPEARRVMSAAEFRAGHSLALGDRFG
jgi:methionyl-tRNA formyltransferase